MTGSGPAVRRRCERGHEFLQALSALKVPDHFVIGAIRRLLIDSLMLERRWRWLSVKTTIGARSRKAHATPLTTDAAPGPSVVRHAPGAAGHFRLRDRGERAGGLGRVSTKGNPALPAAAIRSRLPPPPGTPNSVLTPAPSSWATTRSATVMNPQWSASLP